MVVTHNFATGIWAAKWLTKTKKVFKPNFPIQGFTFETAKETFVYNHQYWVTGIRTVALIKE